MSIYVPKLCKIKKDNQIVVGFCAESQNLLEYAKVKIKKKNWKYIEPMPL